MRVEQVKTRGPKGLFVLGDGEKNMLVLADATLFGGARRLLLLHFIQAALKAMLQRHVIVWSKAETGAHDIDNGLALREQGIHHRSAAGYQRRLEHVREEREDGMEGFPLLRALLLHCDTFAKLAENDEIVNERRGEK